MTFGAWLAASQGRFIDVDGAYGAQCMDLINDYLVRVAGVPRVGGNAIDLPRNRPQGFTWIPNTPTNMPSWGDVIVWGSNVTVGTGPYGHTAVCVLADSMHLLSMDQNWPTGHATQLVYHGYAGVIGWWAHP
jgi:hypothetical protein